MASLGEEAGRVRVRPLTADESFLLGALHLQALRRRGVAPGAARPGSSHVRDLGMAWGPRSAELPAWVAECDEQHVGMAICRVPVLPHVGPGVPELLALEALGSPGPEPIALALVRTLVSWFGHEGFLAVEVAHDVALPPAVLDAARADVLGAHRVSLPTRP